MHRHLKVPIVTECVRFFGKDHGASWTHIPIYSLYFYIMYLDELHLMSQWIPKARVDKAARPGESRIQWVQMVQSCPAFLPLPSYMDIAWVFIFDSERKAHKARLTSKFMSFFWLNLYLFFLSESPHSQGCSPLWPDAVSQCGRGAEDKRHKWLEHAGTWNYFGLPASGILAENF